MSFTSDYEALRKKRLEDELKKNTSKKSSSAKKTSSNSFTDQYAKLREQRTSKKVDIDDIAPASAKTWTDTQSFLERRAEQKAKKSEDKYTSASTTSKRTKKDNADTGKTENTLTEEEQAIFDEVDSKMRNTPGAGAVYTSTKMQKLDGSPLGVQNLSLAANDVEKNAQSKYKEADKGFFKKGAFEDGYQFGDLFKSARATEADFLVNAAKGIGGLVEGVTDLAQYGIAGLADLVGADEFADDLKRVTKKNVVNDLLAPVEKKVNKNSFFADTSDAVMQGVGQVGGIILTGGVGGAAGLGAAGTTALTTGTMFASGAGSGMSEAYSDGATDGEAVSYGLISGAADAVTELIFGGLGKGVNALGFSRGLSSADDMLAKALTSKISNTLAKNAVQLGVKMAGEGFEEWLAGSVQAIGKKITYQDEKELSEIINDENLLEQFIVGALTSGIVQAPGAINSTVKGRDFITGLNSNEQKVVDKEIEKRIAEAEKDGEKLSQKDKGKIKGKVQKDLDRGYISIDTIEEVLGGDSYKQYKDTLDEDERLSQQENELREEFDTLNRMKRGEMTGEQLDRQEELRTQLADIKSQLENKDRKAYQSDVKSRLGDEVYGIVKDSRLAESYNERARRGQAFEADVTKYNEKQRDTVQRAIDSGILNNTNKTHDFVDLLAKLSADRGVSFDFTNNERIKESGFAIEGKVVNGFVTEDGISINIDSPKALETTVGHEVTHVLEKSDVYTELQSALFEYAKSKGEYDGRIETLTKLYEGVEGADIYKELTADLVGEYIFNDAEFVGNLSTNHRNVFQRIYDEIKHLLKLATAGSKEARQLEKAKHVFDEAWKADVVRKKTNSVDTGSSELKRQSKVKNASALKRASKRYNNKMAQSSETLTESETRIREMRDEIKALDNTINELEASETYTNIFNSDTYANINDAEAAFEQWSEETGYDSLLAERENLKNEIAKMERESVANASGETQYSLSDSDGKQLSEGQREYFKDSKMRDENGALKVMYHGSQDAGFHEFNARYSDDDRSFFFVDRNDVAATYSGTSETYEARTIRTTEDMNNFLSEIGYEQYEAVERDGKYELLEDGDHVAYSDTAQGLYDEFCWYEGVGEGDVNYKVYLNLTNPLEIDAKGRPWNKIDAEFSQEVYDRYASLNEAEREALMSLAEWEDFRIFNSEIQEARGDELASAYEKMGEDVNIYDLFSVAADGFSEESMRENARRYLNTREYAKRAKEQGYDGVIFKNIVDNGMYSSGSEGASTVAIAFDSAQIKSVANEKPTSDPDIRFSLSEAVEKSGNLIALHNVHESKLVAALKLGGLPSPSVAITKSDIVHDNYGAITMILNKDAIDPQADSRNKVYGSDAWTPTSSNARTEYEVDYDKMRAFEKKIAELGKKTAGGVYASDSLVRRLGIEDVSEQDAVRIAERLANFDEVKAAYLADIGKTIEPEYKKKEYNKHGNVALQKYIDKVGIQHLASVVADSYTGDMKSIRAEEEAVRQIIRDDYAEKRAYALNRRPELKEERINKYMENNVSIFTIEDFVKDAWKFYEEGGAVTEEIDRAATSSKISEAVNTKELIDWLEPQVAEFLGEPGIYNGKDIFTPSGRRRSFSDTHWEYTAENIVKAMQLVSSRGETWGGTNANTLIATATPSYNSIDEMHADEGRLKLEDKEAYDAILDELEENLESVEHDIMRTTKHHSDNTYDEEQIIGSIITEAATGDRTVKAVKRAFSKEGYTISDRQAERILALYNKADDVPTGYFEAKPERVVGFEEVAVVVIPNNANPQLKQELLNKGFSIAEYDPDVEGSRQKVVNSFEQYMFSLSPEGETLSGRGTSGSDVRLESTAVKEELHPIREDVASVQEDGKQTPRLDRKIDMQYLTEEDDIAPPTRIKKPADVYDVDFAPISEEDAATRARENLASITDEDAPPEVNIPYSNTRDSVSLDKKSIKQISASVGETLALSKKGRKELEDVIQSFSTSENATREGLYNELKERFGTQYDELIHENIAEAKRLIRTTGINVTPSVKSEFGSPAEYVKFMRSNMGRIRFSKQGRYVDEVYQELSGLYPELFPADIGNDADEFMRIAEVAREDATELVPIYLADSDIQDATDMIYGSVLEYAETERMASADENSRRLGDLYSHSNAFTPVSDDIAPPTPREHPRLDPADYVGEQTSIFPETEKKPAETDSLERAYARIDRELKTKKAELAADFRQRRAELESRVQDRGTFFSTEAKKLYDELSGLKKGVRASRDLGYLLDMGYDWKSLKTALAHVSRFPNKTVSVDSPTESVVRELINEKYVDSSYELSELDGEYNKAMAQLDMEAEVERDNARRAHETLKRAELHEQYMNEMKAEFTKRGSDLDRVLKRAKNLSTFATVDNTPQRVMQKALGYKEGGILADLTVNKVAQNETEGIKWLNSFTDRKSGELAKISKKYNIKPGSKESMAAQMYAEGYYVNDEGEYIKYGDHELMADFPNVKVQENIKGLARDPRIRQIYDETLGAINESRVRNGYPEIQRLDNYFLHFQAMGDFFSKNGIPFNPNDIKAKDLPTDINGMTADLKPGQPYFASSQHREGIRTTFDLLGGLEKYLTSAKNQIYHIDDIQKLRALRNYIADGYGQAKGLESIDSMTEEEAQERIKQVFGSHLSTFAKFLNEEANVLAGKTALIDRGLEGIIGRRGITLMKDINKQVGANQVGYNISSPLTNFVADVQAFAKMNKFDFIKGFAEFVSNKFATIVGKGDNFANESSVIIRRKGADAFHRTTWQKIADPGYALMGITDSISTEIIARAKYNELTRKGMDSAQAHYETDKWVSALMGDRSLGQMPQIFNSATLGLITKYQLEVRNQLDSMVYDTIQENKLSTKDIENKLARNAKTAAKVVSTWVGLAVSQHIFGQVFKSIAGYNPAFDIIEAISAAFGWDDEEESEDTVLDNIEQGFLALLEDLPYASVITGGGRIPISAALPIKEVVTGKNNYGQEVSRWKTALEALPYYVMPGGYGQFKKTAAGLSMFDDDLPISGSYTDSGALRFPVEETPLNVAQAALFGQYASKNARDYFDRGQKPLEEKQINEFIDSEMPIQDYWDYRAGLSGLKTLEEKADYINSLDIPLWQKNLFINNIADREEEIDMEDYSEYDSMEEFDFANEYPEKYAFFTENGVSYEDYDSASKETKSAYNWAAKDEDRYAFLVENGVSLADPSAFDTEEKKSAWTWAYKNPEKYEVAKAVTGDVVEYRGYTSELYDIRADKDENGDAIVGSAKEKKIDYINGLDLDYGQKTILFKSLYNADDTYNYDIINYLNEREDISYEQMETILKELGFDVSSDGTISWGD